MIRPADEVLPVRDENLRLIFAAQERSFIAARIRTHRLRLIGSLVWIAASFAAPSYLAQLENPILFPVWARLPAAVLLLSVPFALIYLIEAFIILRRYIGYRREHRRFLGRYRRS